MYLSLPIFTPMTPTTQNILAITLVMYIAPSSGHALLKLNLPILCILRRLFSDVWSDNAVLFERLIGNHSNPPILCYGFNFMTRHACH